ncbi:CDP-diacylglycerol--inositol 3-phosphatidyltransferase 1-like isoform X2 [Punica granatum]|uniref:CDP-diacylglycerol--inositol 3-phosphatidyltransferase n=1 Tax=Punica granatum TaxID=22663 RepID=A0A6P8CCA5_PUNGR|nr:CDP-diacylglycerol--inositol 3-phosphatidyltransferase 1-like isoform X2 [Punica granatum]
MGITHRREGQEKKAPEKAERTRRRRSGVAEGFAGRSSPLALSSTGQWKNTEVSMAKESRPSPPMLSVYLYIPNVIGYLRVLMNCVAFGVCFSNKRLFSVLYFLSFVFDGIDGWCARRFNQVSTFGAVLDMVTDRISTACLLVILSNVYRPGMIFLLLLALDIASHWFQMYSTFLSGKVSHKDVKDSTSWLFKLYYGYRPFMAYCCVACEVLVSSVKRCSALSFLLVVSLFGWTIKQAVNVIQMKTAADVCVLYDIAKKA